MKFTVQFVGRIVRDDGTQALTPLTLTVDAPNVELAWDEFKRRSGLRRWPGDVAPTIVEAE